VETEQSGDLRASASRARFYSSSFWTAVAHCSTLRLEARVHIGFSVGLEMPANDRSRVSNFSSPSLSTPSPVQFSRAICGDLGQAERREWWVTNGRGGYAGGTIAGSLTRRYHGLLVAPVGSPLGRRLLLAKADATLIAGQPSLRR
jgi:hypothetical protein